MKINIDFEPISFGALKQITITDVGEFAFRANAMMAFRHLLVDQTLKQ